RLTLFTSLCHSILLHYLHALLFSMTLRPPIPTLFPYTTLFRSPPYRSAKWDHGFDRPANEAPTLRRQQCHGRGEFPNERSAAMRSEEHTSELQSPDHLVCRLLLEKKKKNKKKINKKK